MGVHGLIRDGLEALKCETDTYAALSDGVGILRFLWFGRKVFLVYELLGLGNQSGMVVYRCRPSVDCHEAWIPLAPIPNHLTSHGLTMSWHGDKPAGVKQVSEMRSCLADYINTQG